MTASRWPMRWQRSSAWSCIAGLHSRSRKATLEARVSVMPWPATRVEQTISCGPSGSWKACTARSRSLGLVGADDVQRVREALDDHLLDLAVRGEDHERLLGRQEVVDPGQRRAELAARGEPAQRVELGEPLGAQGRLDLALELGELQRLLLQPGDDVALGEPVLLLVLQRDRHDDLALLGQLRQHVLLQAPDEAGAAQVPVDALLGAGALEAALEARAGAELLQAAEDPQLGDQLVRVVHHRRAGQADLQRVLGQLLGQPADRAGALGLRVLDVVGLVEDQRLGPGRSPAARGARGRSRS